ncbi:MAG: excinuclease ATPase subunit [Defluviicoccus sp.]|nr:MAG: excinuclease ATPase subunit [Defluviicoccus sp.]
MRIAGLFAFVVVFLFGANVSARDDWLMFPIKDAMSTPDAQQKLNRDVRFYFSGQSHPKVLHTFGEFQSNKKTNAFNKSDKEACEWVFLSAMLSFQDRVQEMGGNAVIDIKSYYKKHLVESPTEYECGAGFMLAGVTFRGTIVTLAK